MSHFVYVFEVGKIVADYAMQVMGGAGYCREYPVERLWRDAKLLEVRFFFYPTLCPDSHVVTACLWCCRSVVALWRPIRRT